MAGYFIEAPYSFPPRWELFISRMAPFPKVAPSTLLLTTSANERHPPIVTFVTI